MACHFPRRGWRHQEHGGVAFRFTQGYKDAHRLVGCGQCIGCRLDWAGDWAARCEKESKLWERNCFITLTYSDDELPIGSTTRSTVSKREFQLFMMRLREFYGPGIRFFGSGEYGAKSDRAHYHALLFNHDFPDKRVWKSGRGNTLFVSAQLEQLWPYGFSTIGSVSFASASYVARYITKKVTGAPAAAAYADREPPFVLMSRRPGIGAGWFDKYKSDVYPSGKIIVGENKTRRAPRYFNKLLQQKDKRLFVGWKISKINNPHRPERTPQQLEAAHLNALARLSLKTQTL